VRVCGLFGGVYVRTLWKLVRVATDAPGSLLQELWNDCAAHIEVCSSSWGPRVRLAPTALTSTS
jgi:hypothetical protein